MILLGSEREVIQNFVTHIYAEDYSGDHLSDIKFNGIGKVINVVNKYKCHEDTINQNDYNNFKSCWKDGEYYNCVSIIGKKVKYHKSELGGNSITIESYDNGTLLTFKIMHMASVYVKEGDIIDNNTILGTQGNTGLVLSQKSRTNPTYGTHVHFQINDEKGNYINPRKYALGTIITNYKSGANAVDDSKNQFKVLAPKINIRESSSVNSRDIGDVYKDEVYTILDTLSDDKYDWYKINTNTDITGWVSNEKGYNWIELNSVNNIVDEVIEEEITSYDLEEDINTDIEENYTLIFTCTKSDLYAIKLNEGEKLYISKT